MPPRVRLDEYRRLAAFRYALRRFLAFSEEAAASVGLTPRQHQALLAVKGDAGRQAIGIGALAERLRIKHHSAVGLVDRLAEAGLLERVAGRQDRRRVGLRLTRAGSRMLARLTAAHRDELRRLRPYLAALLRALAPSRAR